ncbi:MAG TPA: hypothetical protein DCM02_02985 [Flavobacterium sp.]|nr:hypothetical protein [Flavobacterium sp.]HAT75377.1 hypothetical protein [Flavobacterium sp.]HAT80171.1 hypothetical protein [Flavobacterium sp.]
MKLLLNSLSRLLSGKPIRLASSIRSHRIPISGSRGNYSNSFVKTANDLQILDAINGCYEEYKILKKK